MTFNDPKTMLWYAGVQSISVGACVHAFGHLAGSFIITVIYFTITWISLTLSASKHAHKYPFEKYSEIVAVVGVMVFFILAIVAKLLLALITFIVFTLLALNLQTNNYRRFYLGTIVSFVIICVGAAESKSGIYLFWLILFAISLALSLSAAHFAQANNQYKISWSARNYWHICSIVVLLSLVIYLILPRFPAGNLGVSPGSDHFYRDKAWETEASNQSSSYEDQLDELNKDNQKSDRSERNNTSDKNQENSKENKNTNQQDGDDQSNQPRKGDGFHYEGFKEQLDINKTNHTDQKGGGIPPNLLLAYVRSDQPLYLRAKTFDYFDQNRWSRHYDTSSKIEIPIGGLKLNEALNDAQIIHYEVDIETHLGNYIALSAVPTHLNFPSIAIEIDSYGQFRAPGLLRSGTQYGASSAIYIKNQSVFAEQAAPNSVDHFLQLPDTLDTRISELAQSITGSYTNRHDQAVSLEQHLRTHYEYSVSSIYASQGVTPLSDFLFNTKSGHCEYFASALAIMLRTLGIPSRLVTGFSATSQNPLTGYYEIYALDAHAWVEAYIENSGWLILEPTPLYDGPLPEKTKLSAEKIDRYVERLKEIQQLTQENGKSDFNLANIMITLWTYMKNLMVIVLSYLKLLIMQYWMYALSVIVFGVLCIIAWQYSKSYRLTRSILAKARKAQHLDHNTRLRVYTECIEELVRLHSTISHHSMTIEQWLCRFKKIEIPINKMSQYFNDKNYHHHSDINAISDYEALLSNIADLKSSDLNAMLLKDNRK